MAVEKKYKYTTTIKQPQKVGTISLDPNGGVLTEREVKAIKKDPYGASLIEKKLLLVNSETEAAAEAKPDEPESSGDTGDEKVGDTIPDFDEGENQGGGGKGNSPDQEHAGWKPE